MKNGGKATLTVSLPRASTQPVSGPWSTEDGTADGGSAPGADYVSVGPTTLTFTVGQTSKVIEVQTNVDGDTGSETFLVTLSNATNATISPDTATVTITP